MKTNPEDIFRSYGGHLRMSQAVKLGINRHILYALVDQGVVERVSRGVYRLAEMPPIGNPDLVIVGLRIPQAVVCLVSALAFHEITTQIPHSVSIAVARASRRPSLGYPPLSVHKFADPDFKAGVEVHDIDGIFVKIYSPEKTLVDCFKFRNKIGMDVVLEAMRLYKSRRQFNLEAILTYAKVCRVHTVMYPYLEAII